MTNPDLEKCNGFPKHQLLVLLSLGIFGMLSNIVSLFYLKRNFNLKKPMNQVLFMDSIFNIIGRLELVVELEGEKILLIRIKS